MNVHGYNIDDCFRECLKCTLDDCVGIASRRCPVHASKVSRSRGDDNIIANQALPLPDVLSEPALKTQECRRCPALIECAELVASGAPCLCERVGVIWVGRDRVRVEV